jgi:hypothetical protein
MNPPTMADGHGQRQGDDCDCESRNQISAQILKPVPFPQHGHELRREEFGEGGNGRSMPDLCDLVHEPARLDRDKIRLSNHS